QPAAGALQAAGGPLGGVTVTATHQESGRSRSVVTAADGSYLLRLEPGTYDVTFRLFGYGTWIESGLVVAEGEETRLDVRLEVLPPAVISGTVTDAASGAPVAATVMVLDAPLEPAASDPDTGAYRLTVP